MHVVMAFGCIIMYFEQNGGILRDSFGALSAKCTRRELHASDSAFNLPLRAHTPFSASCFFHPRRCRGNTVGACPRGFEAKRVCRRMHFKEREVDKQFVVWFLGFISSEAEIFETQIIHLAHM